MTLYKGQTTYKLGYNYGIVCTPNRYVTLHCEERLDEASFRSRNRAEIKSGIPYYRKLTLHEINANR